MVERLRSACWLTVRLVERLSCWFGELYSLQCRRRSRAWRRAVCEVGVGAVCVVVGRRRYGGSGCSRCLLVAIDASCCDTRWSISTSELGVLCRWRSILSRRACRQPSWWAATIRDNFWRTDYTAVGRLPVLDSRTDLSLCCYRLLRRQRRLAAQKVSFFLW